MKKLLLVIALVALSVGLFAEFTPYGSARLWYGFNMVPELKYADNGVDQMDRMTNVFELQSNSRFGVDWKNDGFTAKAEFGFNSGGYTAGGAITTRLLWAKQDFGGWSLLVGQDYDGAFMVTNQAGGNDLGLIGYGAIDSGRNPQIKFEMENGFYAALIKPEKVALRYGFPEPTSFVVESIGGGYGVNDSTGIAWSVRGERNEDNYDPTYAGMSNLDNYDFLIPKINLGWKGALMNDRLKINGTGMFQMYNTNTDFMGEDYDYSVMSFLVAADIKFDINEQMRAGLQFHVGQNLGNMGVNAAGNILPHNRTNYALLGYKNEWSYKRTDYADQIVTTPDGPTAGRTYSDFELVADDEMEVYNTLSFGGTFTFAFDVNEFFFPSLGFGFAMDTNDLWKNVDIIEDALYVNSGADFVGHNNISVKYSDVWANSRMAFYIQPKFKFEALQLIPEFGMFMEGEINEAFMKDGEWKAKDLDTNMYFGLQLRYDF